MKKVTKEESIPEIDDSIEFYHTGRRKIIKEKIKYLTSCIYWLKEYVSGRCNEKQLNETLNAIEKHCIEIRTGSVEFRGAQESDTTGLNSNSSAK